MGYENVILCINIKILLLQFSELLHGQWNSFSLSSGCAYNTLLNCQKIFAVPYIVKLGDWLCFFSEGGWVSFGVGNDRKMSQISYGIVIHNWTDTVFTKIAGLLHL